MVLGWAAGERGVRWSIHQNAAHPSQALTGPCSPPPGRGTVPGTDGTMWFSQTLFCVLSILSRRRLARPALPREEEAHQRLGAGLLFHAQTGRIF